MPVRKLKSALWSESGGLQACVSEYEAGEAVGTGVPTPACVEPLAGSAPQASRQRESEGR